MGLRLFLIILSFSHILYSLECTNFNAFENNFSFFDDLNDDAEKLGCLAMVRISPNVLSQGLLSRRVLFGQRYAPSLHERIARKGFSINPSGNIKNRYIFYVDYVLVNPRRANDKSYLEYKVEDTYLQKEKVFRFNIPVLVGNNNWSVRNQTMVSMVEILTPSCKEAQSLFKDDYLTNLRSQGGNLGSIYEK